jgi:alkyl hydroperoxide reductase subunit AhpC
MCEEGKFVRIGHPVPEFELNVYDPVGHDFSKISLAQQKEAKKWTILFFYPADFTFV